MNVWDKNDNRRGTPFIFYPLTIDIIVDGKYIQTRGFNSEFEYQLWIIEQKEICKSTN